MTGRIVRGIGGLYTVLAQDGISYECRARGLFRKRGEKPMVGDYVDFDPGSDSSGGYLLAIHQRKNVLVRPPVANLDKLLVVLAARAPAPDWFLADRLIMSALEQEMDCAVAINKSDLDDGAIARAHEDYRPAGIPVLPISVREGTGLDAAREFLSFEDRLGAAGLAGQSAVGKSSLLEVLLGVTLEVGGLSRIERGRHTTRCVELLPLPWGGLVADTPGFSVLEAARGEPKDPKEIERGWPEFEPYRTECRFTGCQHIGEAGCAVAEAAREGVISEERLGRYRKLHAMTREEWSNRYR